MPKAFDAFVQAQLQELQEQGLYRKLRILGGEQQPR